MAGRSEEVQRWGETLQAELMASIDADWARVKVNDDPVVGALVGKRVLAMGRIARTARSVAMMVPDLKPRASRCEILPGPVAQLVVENEVQMNDRPEWTPERTNELHAEVDRRLEKLYRHRESKGRCEGDVAGRPDGMPTQPPAD